jgi:hypothetical protein
MMMQCSQIFFTLERTFIGCPAFPLSDAPPTGRVDAGRHVPRLIAGRVRGRLTTIRRQGSRSK